MTPTGRRPPARRRHLGHLAALGLAILCLAVPDVTAAAAAPATPVVPEGIEQAGSPRLRVVAQTPFVAPEGVFDLRLDADRAAPGATMALIVHGAVTSRSAFERTLAGEGLGPALSRSEPVPVDTLTVRDGARQVLFPVTAGPSGGERTRLTSAGVYPVVVELRGADGDIVEELVTHLIRLGDPAPDRVPLAVAVVVPVHEPPATAADGTLAVDPDAVNRLVGVVDALAAHRDVAVTVVPTPETVAALVTDPAAADVGRQLGAVAAGGELVAGPFVRLDLDAWVGAGLATPGGPLDVQLDAGRAALTTTLGVAEIGSTWVANGPLTGAALRAIAERGVDTIVVPEASVTPVDADAFPVTLTRPFALRADDGGGRLTGVAADAGLAAHVGATGDPVLDAHRVLADLAVLAGDEPGLRRGAVLALPDDETLDPMFLQALLAGIGAADSPPPGAVGPAPILEPATVDGLIELVAPAAEGGGGVDPAGGASGPGLDETLRRTFLPATVAPLGAFPERLATARADVGSLAAAVGPAPVIAALETRILVTGADDLRPPERTRRLQSVQDDVRASLLGITLPAPQVLTLTAREGTVQVTLGNNSGRPVSVRLELEATRLEFPDEGADTVDVRLDEEVTRVDLKVRALGSGDTRLDLRLATPDGRIELDRSRVTVRTTAVSGVGVALSVAAAVFLVVWWTRTIVRERRARRVAAAGAPKHLARS
ncbi:MAG: DUF6049 family protein [Acidimicrobiales bacterium]